MISYLAIVSFSLNVLGPATMISYDVYEKLACFFKIQWDILISTLEKIANNYVHVNP